MKTAQHYPDWVPFKKRWVPDQVPGFPPGVGPATGRGEWAEVFVQSSEEREAAYRSSAAESQRVESECEWIATEASASELLRAVSPGHEPRLFPGIPLLEAWVRLTDSKALPASEHLLHTTRRARRLTLRGFDRFNELEDPGLPVWPAPRGESGVIRNDYLDVQGNLYRPRAVPGCIGETFLMAVGVGGAPDGDAVQLVARDGLMDTVHHWTGALRPAPFVSTVCSALREALRDR